MYNLIRAYHKVCNPIEYDLEVAEKRCRRTVNGFETMVDIRKLTLIIKMEKYNYKEPRFIVEVAGFGLVYVAPTDSYVSKEALLKILRRFLTYV